MMETHVPVIRPQNLNLAEIEKLERLEERLTGVFQQAGYSDVQICEASGDGEQRKLTFYRAGDNASLISLTSVAFLASTSTELCQMIEKHLLKARQM